MKHALPLERWTRLPPGAAGGYRPWLLDHGSLTRRIQLRCETFSVRGVRQREGRIHGRGGRGLGRVLVREVFLHCGESAVVYASSVLPLDSLCGPWRRLGALGTKPLGAVLFADPRVKRLPLCFKKLHSRHVLYRRASEALDQKPSFLWARRSEFRLGQGRIWVTEVFLPAILEL
ncbi:MAG: chorismate lyase [Sulfuricellaceae bacterium]